MDNNYKEEMARLREKCERMGREREKKAVILTTHEPSFYSYWPNRVCLKVDPNDMFDMWVQCKAARRMRIDVEVDFNPVGFYEVTYVSKDLKLVLGYCFAETIDIAREGFEDKEDVDYICRVVPAGARKLEDVLTKGVLVDRCIKRPREPEWTPLGFRQVTTCSVDEIINSRTPRR